MMDLECGRVSLCENATGIVTSPLGLVPKHDGGHRRIHDLSFPPGTSINDGIPKIFGTIEYTTFDDIAARTRQGNLIVKRDIKDAFRIVLISLHYRRLLGFGWQGVYYTENCLHFWLADSTSNLQPLRRRTALAT
jgi:hypothetical protein